MFVSEQFFLVIINFSIIILYELIISSMSTIIYKLFHFYF